MWRILRLLRLPSLDSPAPCRLITVATSVAASAAAMLLCYGGYVIAYPGSLIHFHGVRTYRQDAITKEDADHVAKDLKASNDSAAVSLAKTRSKSFFFRFVTLRCEFAEYRKKNPKAISEKDCFVGVVSERLSPWGLVVLQRAESRNKRYSKLSSLLLKSGRFGHLTKTPGKGAYRQLEAEILKGIIRFEMPAKGKDPDWTFESEGLAQVNNDFYLLNEYIGNHQASFIEEFCEEWKYFILEDADMAEIEALPEDQRKTARVSKLRPVLLPLWLFFGSICHVLQEAENPLTPDDAFWLGLIDEVTGANLPTLRRVIERQPRA